MDRQVHSPGPAGRDAGRPGERTVGEVERVLTSKGTATRQRIVAGAAELVRDRGAANVSLDDIRTATTTSKSQLFHYFPDGKSDLLLAVARFEAQQVLDDQQPMLSDLTSWAAWLSWRDRGVEKYRAQGPGCPLSALTSQLGLADPATRDVITDLYARWHRYLADGVRALVAAGEIDPAPHRGGGGRGGGRRGGATAGGGGADRGRGRGDPAHGHRRDQLPGDRAGRGRGQPAAGLTLAGGALGPQ